MLRSSNNVTGLSPVKNIGRSTYHYVNEMKHSWFYGAMFLEVLLGALFFLSLFTDRAEQRQKLLRGLTFTGTTQRLSHRAP